MPNAPAPSRVSRTAATSPLVKRAALSGGKIIAEANAFPDRGAEVREVVLGDGRQCLHQDQTANVIGVRVGHWRKSGESRHFVRVHACPEFFGQESRGRANVRKLQTADDRRRPWFIPAAAVNDQSAAGKKPDADARARSAPQLQRITFDIKGQVVQPAHAGGHRERKLRAGTETGMGGNNFRNVHSDARRRAPATAPLFASIRARDRFPGRRLRCVLLFGS